MRAIPGVQQLLPFCNFSSCLIDCLQYLPSYSSSGNAVQLEDLVAWAIIVQCARYGNMIKHDKTRILNAANYMSFAPSPVSKLPSAKVPCFAAKKRKKSRHILRPKQRSEVSLSKITSTSFVCIQYDSSFTPVLEDSQILWQEDQVKSMRRVQLSNSSNSTQ